MKTFTILAAAALAAATAPAVSAAPATAVSAHVQEQSGPQRGAVVRSAGGAELGRLEGRRTTADGAAEIVVRGEDGQMRAIPASAVMIHGDELHATWSEGQFRAAEILIPVASVAAPATGAGGNQGPGPESDTTRPRNDGPGQDQPEDATRPTPVEQQQAPDADPQ